jgi:hypothetical protein
MGQFQTDVGIELIGSDLVKNLVVKLRAVPGFFRIRNVLAKIVDGDAHACTIYGLRSTYGIRNFSAGDKAPGNTPAQRRAFGEMAHGRVFRELDEERPQHGIPTERAPARGRKGLDTWMMALNNVRATEFVPQPGARILHTLTNINA